MNKSTAVFLSNVRTKDTSAVRQAVSGHISTAITDPPLVPLFTAQCKWSHKVFITAYD